MASERFQGHIDRLLDQVDEAMRELNWEQVRDRSQAVLALDPNNQDSLTFLAAVDRALSSDSPTQPTSTTTAPRLTVTPD